MNQSEIEKRKAGTKSDRSKIADVISVSQTIAKPNVVGSTLSEFINENLQKSKDEKWTNEMFGAGWIAALMHVKVNFLEKVQ